MNQRPIDLLINIINSLKVINKNKKNCIFINMVDNNLDNWEKALSGLYTMGFWIDMFNFIDHQQFIHYQKATNLTNYIYSTKLDLVNAMTRYDGNLCIGVDVEDNIFEIVLDSFNIKYEIAEPKFNPPTSTVKYYKILFPMIDLSHLLVEHVDNASI